MIFKYKIVLFIQADCLIGKINRVLTNNKVAVNKDLYLLRLGKRFLKPNASTSLEIQMTIFSLPHSHIVST